MRSKLLGFLLFLLPFASFAQEIEVGLSLGASNYFGDLAPYPVPGETGFTYGAFGRLNVSPSFAFTASILQIGISGHDKNFEYNKDRNLSFETAITEYAATVEFNFFKYGIGPIDKRLTPYVYAGFAISEFYPEAIYRGNRVGLRSLRTENVNYDVNAYAIPFGMGFKWQINRSFAAEFNLGFRKTFTDYLDDVSTVYPDIANEQAQKGVLWAALSDRSAELYSGIYQNSPNYRRGNDDFSDWYMISTVSLTYRLFKKIKCARFY